MKGVLILAHGSRENGTVKTMEAISGMVREKLPGTVIETAYLQFRDQNVAWGLKSLVDQGVDDICVVPYFLFSGVHIHHDIPGEIDDFLRDRPGVKVTISGTLGADDRLADILADRIRETL